MEPQYIFLTVWFILAISLLSIMYIRGKKALEQFPNLDTVNILFRERKASGNSLKSFQTKYGGASKVLEIIVTDNELWLKSPLLIAGFGDKIDLLHKVKLTNILSADINKKDVIIVFITENKIETKIRIRMKNREKFIEIIKKKRTTFAKVNLGCRD